MLSAVVVGPAIAKPKGEYKVFRQCPVSTPKVGGCVVSRTEGGEIKLDE